MDPQNDRAVEQCYRLLALCARAEAHPAMDEELSHQIAGFTAWDNLPAQAELHGMAPLLRYHLKRAEITIPEETKRALDGLYLRHRVLNQTHTETLLEITSLFEQAGIRALVLKGLALAHEYYPEPALRPTSDIDLLLQTEDVPRALDILKESGFNVSTPQPSRNLLPKELTVSTPLKKGITTRIELHHHDPRNLSAVDGSLDDEFSGFTAPPHQVKVGESYIYVPDPLDTLNYLFRHFLRHMFVANQASPLPLRWLADIVNLVEKHAETIAWEKLFKEDPALKNRLEVIYSLIPFPEKLANSIPINRTTPPKGVNCYPNGWPQQVYPEWKRAGMWTYFTKTLGSPKYVGDTVSVPSPWWLKLQYGIDDKSVFWYGQIVYRLKVLKIAFAKIFK